MKETEAQSYDILGDIHGHADELSALLETLGYRDVGTSHRHPEGRKVIFLGDYIDRGPKIREVLQTVRRMVDAGQALAILGNHEINAMRFSTRGADGEFLRPHKPNNVKQHKATLDQFPDADEWAQWLAWFAKLPLSLDFGNLRAVHACWDDQGLRELGNVGPLEGEVLEKYSKKRTPAYETISRIINGPEAFLPPGYTHETADGRVRPEFRVKWWRRLEGLPCSKAIFPENPTIPDLPPRNAPWTEPYPTDAPPTFFGHYALKDAVPKPILPNLACLDYGTGKGGFLCAYRWDGESTIDPSKFVNSRSDEEMSKAKLTGASPLRGGGQK